MQCPSCSAPTTVVVISEGDCGTPIKRRRQCRVCGLRFTTVVTLSLVINRTGVTEPFSRQVMLTTVRTAAQRNLHVANALAQRSRSSRRPGCPPTRHFPELRSTEPSASGGWSPFSLASASGRG